jgi:hypothetical protein
MYHGGRFLKNVLIFEKKGGCWPKFGLMGNRLSRTVGVLNFQQDPNQQPGTGPLEYRVPIPGVPIVSGEFGLEMLGDRWCMSHDVTKVRHTYKKYGNLCTVALWERKLFISGSCPILVLTTVMGRVACVTLMLKTVYFPRKCNSKIPKFPPYIFLNPSVIMT